MLAVVVVGAVVMGAVVLGTVPAGAVVAGTPTGAVAVGVRTDDDVPGARVADGIDLSPPATTTPTEVLAPGRGRLPNKLASGCLATASTTVIAPTAIPKATTAATATRCQRIGWGCAWLAPSSPAPSSPAPACSPTPRTSERRATRWADASEWVYRASAGATSRLTSAAPMRVPSTPKKDATTAPLTAASAPASNLETRSCSIPHLDGRVGDGGAAVWGPRAWPDGNPAAAWRAPTLATQAGSRQLPPGQGGDRAAWGGCSLGDRFVIAALVQRAERKAPQGSGGPEVANDPAHVVPPRVHQSQRACTLSDRRAGILRKDQESCSSVRARRARWLTRNNARAALSNAPTNSQQIQHWAKDVDARLATQRQGRGARLVQVVLAAGLQVRLVRTWPGPRALERQLKNRHEAPRLCPACSHPTTPPPPITLAARGPAIPTPPGTSAPAPPGEATLPGLVLPAGQTRRAIAFLDAAEQYWGPGQAGRAALARELAAALGPAAAQGRALPHLLRDGARWAGHADDPDWLSDGFALALHTERALTSPQRTPDRATRGERLAGTKPVKERGHER